MRTKYKFVLLIFTACICSIFIYYFCEKAQPVSYVQDIITYQNKVDSTELAITSYTIEDPKIIIDPYGISPLTALIIFETKDLTTPKLTVVGKNSDVSVHTTFKPGKVHYLPVYGLYPDYENTVIVTVNNKNYEFKINTEALPDDFVKATNAEVNSSEIDGSNDFYFVTPSSDGYTAAYDINGDVRWYLDEFFLWDIERLNNGNIMLSTNRLVNPPYYMTGLVEMDLLGKIYYEYSIPGGYHHDYFELNDGNLIVASDNFENGTVEDYVVEIDRETGKIVKEIDLTKILPTTEGLNPNYSTEYDWFHNNSVWYDEKTNSLTLSGRHVDSIVNIDYDTNEINWIVGSKENWDKKYHKYFFTPIGDLEWQYAQHAAMILPNGDLFVFDNGNNKSKNEKNNISAKNNYSRGVIYRLNTNDMTIRQIYQYGKELGSSFYSPYISDVDYLANDHYLIHSGGISSKDGVPSNVPAAINGSNALNSITVEVKNNKEIFRLELPSNYYRAEKMPLYSNNEYKPKEGIKLGNLGVTTPNSINSIILFNKDGDTAINEYNLKFTKEEDRLVVSGTFKKSDDVQIILDNVFDKKTYDVVISKKPYTALCVDVFTKDEEANGINVTKYINNEGLGGKYYLYMKINGKYYDFDRYIEF